MRAAVALSLAAVLVFVAVVQLKGRYVLPEGYGRAARTWQEAGLVPAAERQADGSLEYPYDVVVWGSDPEGVAAAVAAARNGLHTLLVDSRDRVGGLFTLGQLNLIDMNRYRARFGRRLLTRGIFEEFLVRVGGAAFDLDRAQQVLEAMLAKEELLAVRLGQELAGPLVDVDRITALSLREGEREYKVYGSVFVDASQDADLAYLAGVPFSHGFEDIGLPGKYMVSTLVFSLEGVSWPRVMWETLVVDRRPSSGATFRTAWGYDRYINEYRPENDRIGFRGFNMVRQGGRVYVNGLLIYGLDPLDREARAAAAEEAKAEVYRFVLFARENLPGFARARVAGFAPELYVRQSRHMQALYRLSIDDVLEDRDFYDGIGYGSYPVDIQAIDKHLAGVVVGVPERYGVPLRSLVPPGIPNLLVVGRSAGYSSLAHGSARVVPVGMVGGQAAGVACAYALAKGVSFQEMARDPAAAGFVREVLAAQGALVGLPEVVAAPRPEHYGAAVRLRRLGLLAAGYHNDYRLEAPLSAQQYLNLLYHGAYRQLNLAGRGELAGRTFYVTADRGGDVSGADLAELNALFYKYNPHLAGLCPPEQMAAQWQKWAVGEGPVPRGVLYEVIAWFLEALGG